MRLMSERLREFREEQTDDDFFWWCVTFRLPLGGQLDPTNQTLNHVQVETNKQQQGAQGAQGARRRTRLDWSTGDFNSGTRKPLST